MNGLTTMYRTYVGYERPGVDGQYRVNGLTTKYKTCVPSVSLIDVLAPPYVLCKES